MFKTFLSLLTICTLWTTACTVPVTVCGEIRPDRKDDLIWENEFSGYRAFGPGIQAKGDRLYGYDIFTKSVTYPVLHDRYAKALGPEKLSFHLDHGDGMDSYGVGATLGCGTAALLDSAGIVYPWCWKEAEILENGPRLFQVRLTYPPMVLNGKEVTEHRLITLDSGERLNRVNVTYEGLDEPCPIVVGVVVHAENPDGWHADKNVIAVADLGDRNIGQNGEMYCGAVLPGGFERSGFEAFPEPVGQAIGHVLGHSTYYPGTTFTYYFGSGWSKAGIKSLYEWINLIWNGTVGTRAEALDGAVWAQSQWISAADMPVVTGSVNSREGHRRAADGASWFLASVKNPAEVVSAKWMTSALGVYELYLNGKPVGADALKPGFTHPEKTRLSYTYDITAAFNKASGAGNELSAQVTPGWWADKVITPNGHDGMVGRKPAFRAVLELTFAGGRKQQFGTDTTAWTAGVAGPVTHAGIYDGEEYDARILPGFLTPEKLGTPELNTEFAGEIVPAAGAEVCYRHDLALAPAKAYVYKDVKSACKGEYGKVVKLREYGSGNTMELAAGETLIVDFGQNAAAVPEFVFEAEAGTSLTFLPAELLNDGNGAESRGMDGPEGSVHRTNLRAYTDCFRLDYTFGPGNTWVKYMPRCTFFGYRFASITASGSVKIRSLRSVPVTSITAGMETGTITTGNEDINRLISNTWWSQLSNYLSVPTDCPQRNERQGWTADTQVYAETGSFFANTAGFLRKWMGDMRDTQVESGSFLSVAPLGPNGRNPMRFGWSDAGIIVPWIVWRHFADVDIIKENWDAMERYIGHVAETRYDYALIADECDHNQYADWLSFEPLESAGRSAFTPKDANGKRHPLPEATEYWSYLGACYWAIDAGMMRDMAAAVRKKDAARRYEAIESEAKAYIREKFLTVDGRFKLDILNTMQTPALFALKLGLVEGEAKEAMIAGLRENFAAHDGCLQTGFLGTSILMQTLTENGMADIAWNLLFQRRNPSWLYSIDNGATTIWERWNSYTLEKGMGPKGMNSFNHYAYGCVCQWLWESAAGIAADVSKPGFKHIIMKPVPDKRLGSIDAVYHSPAGTIRSAWKYEGDAFTWTFTIPKGAKASVTIPGEKSPRTYSSGTYTVKNL